ncbi:DUF3040 domain-containing protein [Nesterenkonia aerolata]|uniref:DUF3040 domain-containing protein n=1 Tax=Nesterenkonia aerolata TaxID=3074079 RepID=A0ABU2DPM7_9MICC|nr:DUF3040 domain-containing protein [Nesterenkonia sp. LY-0111]MDR8018468.1 DUF3040 domain-containing protein [Nesterenkonia sp. LY-0111]
MALSEHEQRMLKQMEEQLQSEDPGFATSMQESPAVGTLNVRSLVLGLLVAVAGVGVLILGISSQLIIVGVAGFLVMGVGVYFATAGSASRRTSGGSSGGGNGPGGGGGGPRGGSGSSGSGSFMSGLEQRWEERRRQD